MTDITSTPKHDSSGPRRVSGAAASQRGRPQVIPLICLLMGFGSMFQAATPSAQAQSLSAAANSLAIQVKAILKERKLAPGVSVGRFESRSGPVATLGMQDLLQRELQKLDVATDNSDVLVSGKIRRNELLMAVSGNLTIQATGDRIPIGTNAKTIQMSHDLTQLFKRKGLLNSDESVSAVVEDREDVVALTAPTFEARLTKIPQRQRLESLKDEIKYGIEEPEVHIIGSTVSAFSGGEFAMELLTKDARGQFTQHPRITTDGIGHAFADLRAGDQVGIRVINNSGYDVGVRILVDGLNSFSFSTIPAYRKLGLYFIERLNGRPAKQFAHPIRGWHLDNANVYGFDVTTLPKSAARELNREQAGDIGVITVQFFPAWNRGENPPAAELAASQGAPGRGLAMGKGEVTAMKSVEVERFFGKTIVAAISVRYAHTQRKK